MLKHVLPLHEKYMLGAFPLARYAVFQNYIIIIFFFSVSHYSVLLQVLFNQDVPLLNCT